MNTAKSEVLRVSSEAIWHNSPDLALPNCSFSIYLDICIYHKDITLSVIHTATKFKFLMWFKLHPNNYAHLACNLERHCGKITASSYTVWKPFVNLCKNPGWDFQRNYADSESVWKVLTAQWHWALRVYGSALCIHFFTPVLVFLSNVLKVSVFRLYMSLNKFIPKLWCILMPVSILQLLLYVNITFYYTIS